MSGGDQVWTMYLLPFWFLLSTNVPTCLGLLKKILSLVWSDLLFKRHVNLSCEVPQKCSDSFHILHVKHLEYLTPVLV